MITTLVLTRHGDRAPAKVLPNEDETWMCTTQSSVLLHLPNSKWPTSTHQAESNRHYASPFSSTMWKGNCEVSGLTDLGARQHLELGRALAKIYPIDSYEKIYVRSTRSSRTILSAVGLIYYRSNLFYKAFLNQTRCFQSKVFLLKQFLMIWNT